MVDSMKIVLRSLGFAIHAEKSNLIPKTKLGILALTNGSVKMEVSITQSKKKQLITNSCKFKAKTRINKKTCTNYWQNSFLFPGSMYGPLCYRKLNANNQYGLCKNNGDFESATEISSDSKKETD